MIQAGHGYDLYTPEGPTALAVNVGPSIAASLKRVKMHGCRRPAATCSRCLGNPINSAVPVARASVRVNHTDPADTLQYVSARNGVVPPMGLATHYSQPSSRAMSQGRVLPMPNARS